MDVKRSPWALLFLALILSACSEDKTVETVFPRSADECLSSASQKRYLVKWESGEVTIEKGRSRDQFANTFVKDHLEQIAYVEHDQIVQLQPAAELTIATEEKPVDNWGAINTEADVAWSQGIRGKDVIVAVIDSGVDITHPQLQGQVAFNDGEMGLDANGQNRSANGIDDDGNGFVDDAAGYDFVADSPYIGDYNFHGTHVAGIIAAFHNDESAEAAGYVQGVAPEAKILPLAFISERGGGLLGDAIKAIDYAVSRGAHIINASWGGSTCSQVLKDKVAELEQKGVIFVAAAGNGNPGINIDRKPQYPASFQFPHQITVGSISEHNGTANHSNYGYDSVTLFAPGVNVFSTVPNSGIAEMSGTSMAAPFVAGAAALLLGQWPQATAGEINEVLRRSVVQDRYYQNATQGRLNIARALAEMQIRYPAANPQ